MLTTHQVNTCRQARSWGARRRQDCDTSRFQHQGSSHGNAAYFPARQQPNAHRQGCESRWVPHLEWLLFERPVPTRRTLRRRTLRMLVHSCWCVPASHQGGYHQLVERRHLNSGPTARMVPWAQCRVMHGNSLKKTCLYGQRTLAPVHLASQSKHCIYSMCMVFCRHVVGLIQPSWCHQLSLQSCPGHDSRCRVDSRGRR